MKVEKKKTESGKIKARLLILEARFYADMCDELAKGAIAALERSGATWDRVGRAWRPGSAGSHRNGGSVQALRWLCGIGLRAAR